MKPSDLRAAAQRQYERLHLGWIADPAAEQWPLRVTITAPSEAQAAADTAAFKGWLAEWRGFEESVCKAGTGASGPSLTWRTVAWRKLGSVEMPKEVTFSDAEAVASLASTRATWRRLSERCAILCDALPGLTADRRWVRAVGSLADWDEPDFGRLLTLLRWLVDHPSSNLYLRQLPLMDIHTKWVEARATVVTALAGSLLGRDGDLRTVLGLKRAPVTVRMRLLDPALRAQVGGAEDLQMPPEQWGTALALPPSRLLIVENQATGLALPDLPGTAVAFELGNNVVSLKQVTWVHHARLVYWGDIDTWGLHILSRARAIFPKLESVLMTAEVIAAHRELLTKEDSQAKGMPERLTEAERDLLEGLVAQRWGERVRLEQERLNCLPCDHTQIGRFRRVLGEVGVEQLLKTTIEAAVGMKAIKAAEFERVIVDTTVQEKAIAHLTDSRLLEIARAKITRLAKWACLKLKQC